MEAIIFLGFIIFMVISVVYAINHPINIETIHANTDEYSLSKMWHTQYGGTFKTLGYKIRHKDVMFVNPNKDADNWKVGDCLVVDTGGCGFERNKYYLFKHGSCSYRIARCTSIDKIGTFPPLFDGSETLITHDCIGRVVGVLRDKGEIEII